MSDRIATRCLMRHGTECLLYMERPLEDGDGAWMTRVGLVEGSREGWSRQVYGCDGLQSLLLALRLAKTLLEAEGGFSFLGGEDLMLDYADQEVPDSRGAPELRSCHGMTAGNRKPQGFDGRLRPGG